MVEFEVPTLESGERMMITVGQIQNLDVPISIMLPQRNHPDILNQGRQKRFVGVAALHDGRECACRAGGVDASSPIVFEVEENLFFTLECSRKAESEHQTLDRLQSEIRQCLS